MRPHIFIATPCYGGWVGHGYMQSVVGFTHLAERCDVDTTLAMLAHDALISRSRNSLVRSFMESNATHLLFVDADISFHPSVPIRLLDADKPIVAGLYPVKTHRWERGSWPGEPAETGLLDYVGVFAADAETDGDFITADYAGTGLMLIARTVIETMIAAYPGLAYGRIDAHDQSPSARFHALFDCSIDRETGTYLSEDFHFCRLWRALGGQIWLDRRSRITHTGGTDFNGDPAARFLAASPPSGRDAA